MSFVDFGADIANQLIGDAAVPYALFYSPGRFIGTLLPHITVREVHTDEDTITTHPAETGTPVSDHVYANPQVLEIQCGWSDSSGGYVGYVQDVYQSILDLKAQRQTFDVSTGKRYYTDMLFGNVTVVTDATAEFALMVTVRLQQVIMTDPSGGLPFGMTPGNQADPASTAPPTNAGNQQPAIAPTPPGPGTQAAGGGGGG